MGRFGWFACAHCVQSLWMMPLLCDALTDTDASFQSAVQTEDLLKAGTQHSIFLQPIANAFTLLLQFRRQTHAWLVARKVNGLQARHNHPPGPPQLPQGTRSAGSRIQAPQLVARACAICVCRCGSRRQSTSPVQPIHSHHQHHPLYPSSAGHSTKDSADPGSQSTVVPKTSTPHAAAAADRREQGVVLSLAAFCGAALVCEAWLETTLKQPDA
ncbi:hypothetical protein IWX49DRAFT_266669 [Phyllosticta citricarpa]|uniref:Uncharacterized protein n=1 Tax=Phyllosticta citricarpa TaxID=55181 RepID=A0ABR1LLK5_9PEZI